MYMRRAEGKKKKGLEFNSIKEGAGSKTPTPTYIYVKIPKLKKGGRIFERNALVQF